MANLQIMFNLLRTLLSPFSLGCFWSLALSPCQSSNLLRSSLDPCCPPPFAANWLGLALYPAAPGQPFWPSLDQVSPQCSISYRASYAIPCYLIIDSMAHGSGNFLPSCCQPHRNHRPFTRTQNKGNIDTLLLNKFY